MKKVIIAAFILLSFAASAQKKEDVKISPKETKAVVVPKVLIDTLAIADSVKYIKVGGKTFPTELLKKALLVLDEKQVGAFIDGLQNFAARCANPITEYFTKSFGITIAPPPSEQKK